MKSSVQKIKEALSTLVKTIDEFDSDPLWWHNGAKGVKPLKDAKEALSIPLRNCDVLSAEQCKERFEHEMRIYMTKEATDRDRDIARCTAYGVIDAMFATSTETEGDNDGSK